MYSVRLPFFLSFFLSFALLIASSSAWAQDTAAEVGAADPLEEVRACMSRNRPAVSAVQTVSLTSRDRTGAERESRATVYWQKHKEEGAKVMLRFFSPPDMRGAGLLVLQKDEDQTDMFMYLPEVGRVRRVTQHMAGGSMFGTDFTYEDFERIHGLAKEGKATRLPDEELDGAAVYVIDGLSDEGEGKPGQRSLAYVDQETCIARKVEFYEKGDRLRRVLTSDVTDLIEEGGLRIPRQIAARDLRDNTESTLVVEKIEIDDTISRKIFSVHCLEHCKN